MKKLLLAATTCLSLAAPAWAGGPAPAVMDPVVIEAQTSSASEGAAVAIVAVTALLIALAIDK